MSPPHVQSRSSKKPRAKKRHTTPCWYFQAGSCPHVVQEHCKFAHVYSDQLSVPAQGTFNGVYLLPTPASMSPYTDGFRSSFEFGPPQFLAPNLAVFPVTPFNSMDSGLPSSSHTSSQVDDSVPLSACNASGNHFSYFNTGPEGPHLSSPYADDATLSQFPHYALRLPSSVMPATYGIAPGYYTFGPKPLPPAGFSSSASFPPQPESLPERTPTAIKYLNLANYRSKPCRFFKPGRICRHGDTCKFSHLHEQSSGYSSSSSPPGTLQHELPSKPLSAKEVPSRRRASSVPSTPITTRVDVLRLFSAESPAGL
ncbi:hypothetical protein FB451DRAFT_1559337 [Mycena latifolia]|nr:hypothetical protein FB451DRAFT_1572361 [Mycena latifolia]KAJ7470740.1 hypothetical protein FB451DRAFT_1559337 [Mycena latifolia]